MTRSGISHVIAILVVAILVQAFGEDTEHSQMSLIGDAYVPVAEKIGIIRRLDCDQAGIWGPSLSRLLSEPNDDALLVAAIIKLRCSDEATTRDALVAFAFQSEQPLHLRILATKSVRGNLSEDNVRSLLAISENRDDDLLMRSLAADVVLSDRVERNSGHALVNSQRPRVETYTGETGIGRMMGKRQVAHIEPAIEAYLVKRLMMTTDGDEKFMLVQFLGNGSRITTLRTLMEVYGGADVRLRCEIALAVSKLAGVSEESRLLSLDFLKKGADETTDTNLESILRKCIETVGVIGTKTERE